MKKPVVQYAGKVINGKFKLEPKDKEHFILYCQKLKDGIYYISHPKKAFGLRSGRQNRYYWVLMSILGFELGVSKDEMHDLCKQLFLVEKHWLFGIGIPKSSATLSKYDFIIYIDDIRMWAATSYLEDGRYEYSLPIPIILPDPVQIELTG